MGKKNLKQVMIGNVCIGCNPEANCLRSGAFKPAAGDLRLATVEEKAIPREALYLADEIFFTGTAAEVTPIRSVDRIEIGPGCRGPITKRLQDAFFGLFYGETEDSDGWLEPVESPAVAAAGSA